MTSEAALTKMMVALGRASGSESLVSEVRAAFATNCLGEMD